MLAKILSVHTPLTPGFLFSESSHDAYQINGNEVSNTIHANVLPFYTTTSPGWGQKVKTFFVKVMLHIKLKGNKCRSLCK